MSKKKRFYCFFEAIGEQYLATAPHYHQSFHYGGKGGTIKKLLCRRVDTQETLESTHCKARMKRGE
jgi:hypothetical protein